MSAIQCAGITVKGARCLKAPQAGSSFCHVHSLQAGHAKPARTTSSARKRAGESEGRAGGDEKGAACRGRLGNGQHRERATAARNHHCFEHQQHPGLERVPSSPRRGRAHGRERSVSFSSPPPSRPHAPTASPRLLASFTVEELQGEILRRIPACMRSASLPVDDDKTDSSSDDGEDLVYYCG
ncbi:hypothetical protein MPH_13329 [Macrophomina phaseolina MS6]|uniref:Uncharacterized protein n=1 Tax=Macrophomina phaseolina (strain MS6) TaxID=1126212 RepID=K2QIK3_MACPH|nr:hypothetical protein MPH_13329 [Macrophomina phaseolina MS6]